VSDVECNSPVLLAPRIGLIWTRIWFLVQLCTGAGNESGTPPPGKKEAVRRAEISSRPSATWTWSEQWGLILSSYDK